MRHRLGYSLHNQLCSDSRATLWACQCTSPTSLAPQRLTPSTHSTTVCRLARRQIYQATTLGGLARQRLVVTQTTSWSLLADASVRRGTSLQKASGTRRLFKREDTS